MTTTDVRCECGSAYEGGEWCHGRGPAKDMVTVYVVPAYLRGTAQAAHGGYDRRMATAYRVLPECADAMTGPAYCADTCDDGVGLGEWAECPERVRMAGMDDHD